MFESGSMFELNVWLWIIVIFCAFSIGFSKTGLPSLGILVVAILSQVFPTKASVGILLPMLIVGDIFAVVYYRRNVVWKYLVTLIPWVLIGILLGFFVLKYIDNSPLQVLIGILVSVLVIYHFLRNKVENKLVSASFTQSTWFSVVMGGLAGFATMIGNAAGGIMAVYLLSKRLPKTAFVGTGAWFYLTVNTLKVPFNVNLQLITWETLTFNALMVPAIVAGAIFGKWVLPKIPDHIFQNVILILALIGAIRLMIV